MKKTEMIQEIIIIPKMLQLADFDFNIDEIMLVHKNTLIHNFRWTEYRSGRIVDGLVFCISGQAVYECPNERFSISAGQILFLSSNMAYTMRCESMEAFHHFTVNFRLSAPKDSAQDIVSEIIAGRLCHIAQTSSLSRIPELFGKLLSVWQGKRRGYRVMAKAILYELLYLYFHDARLVLRDSTSYERLRPAITVLDSAYDADYSVMELAEMCSLSETHFRRLFRSLFCMTPVEYRQEKRILRARDLLMSGYYSVTETSRMTGFSDPSYFAKVFRRHTGSSPHDFMNP